MSISASPPDRSPSSRSTGIHVLWQAAKAEACTLALSGVISGGLFTASVLRAGSAYPSVATTELVLSGLVGLGAALALGMRFCALRKAARLQL